MEVVSYTAPNFEVVSDISNKASSLSDLLAWLWAFSTIDHSGITLTVQQTFDNLLWAL